MTHPTFRLHVFSDHDFKVPSGKCGQIARYGVMGNLSTDTILRSFLRRFEA